MCKSRDKIQKKKCFYELLGKKSVSELVRVGGRTSERRHLSPLGHELYKLRARTDYLIQEGSVVSFRI